MQENRQARIAKLAQEIARKRRSLHEMERSSDDRNIAILAHPNVDGLRPFHG
jgi:hypothetical protein